MNQLVENSLLSVATIQTICLWSWSLFTSLSPVPLSLADANFMIDTATRNPLENKEGQLMGSFLYSNGDNVLVSQ